MILKVFSYVGARLSVAGAYSQLVALYTGQPFPKNKAAGSLGGAINGGVIVLRNGFYIRVR